MAVGIHKPGQGYWVRVLTACYLGVLFLAAAAWCASQAKLILENIPKSTFEINLSTATGTLSPGQTVTVSALNPADPTTFVAIGTAHVAAYDPANRRLTVDGVVPSTPATTPGGEPTMEWDRAKRIEVAGTAPGAPASFTSTFTGRASGVSAIEPVVLQGIVAGVVIAVGAVLTLMFVAWRPKAVDFLIATDMEMRKVNWSTRKDIVASTWVVIFTCVMLAVGLFIVDYGFKTFFQQIGILVK